jgi:dienelactone hydrolase
MGYEAALSDYEKFEFDDGHRKRDVYKRGSGPAVIIIHEMPGLHPLVIAFADRVAAAGMSVYCPNLFGQPGRPANHPLGVLTMLGGICIRREFNVWATDKSSSPIVDWLRALARKAHADCGGKGVGAVGMCFTGGFALAMMTEPAVVAPVLSPAVPAAGRQEGPRRGIGVSPRRSRCAKQRFEDEDLSLLGLSFHGDPFVPPDAVRDAAADLRRPLRGHRAAARGRAARHRRARSLGADHPSQQRRPDQGGRGADHQLLPPAARTGQRPRSGLEARPSAASGSDPPSAPGPEPCHAPPPATGNPVTPPPRAPRQRQLRAGELTRHALVEVMREEIWPIPTWPACRSRVTQVRMSPDLRHAICFVEPLGGEKSLGGDRGSAEPPRQVPARAPGAHHRDEVHPGPEVRPRRDLQRGRRINALFDDPKVAQDLAGPTRTDRLHGPTQEGRSDLGLDLPRQAL